MLTSIDINQNVMFIFDTARLGLFSSANHQIADVTIRFVFLACCSCHVFSFYFAYFLAIFCFQNQNNSTSSPVFSVNGALTCKKAALLTSSVH